MAQTIVKMPSEKGSAIRIRFLNGRCCFSRSGRGIAMIIRSLLTLKERFTRKWFKAVVHWLPEKLASCQDIGAG